MTPEQETKQRAITLLCERYAGMRGRLANIDHRLVEYYDDLTTHCSADPNDAHDYHNAYEVLCAVKFLRLLTIYPMRPKRVQHAISLYEGEWRDGRYVDGSGGFKFSGLNGYTHYRLQPFQVYILAWAFGLHKWVDTRHPNGSRPLMLTERKGEGGTIQDLRWLATDIVLFLTRKSGKTLMSSFFGAECFFFGDSNAEIYCAANSQEQSKILYQMIKSLLYQLDPNGRRIRMTATECNWKMGQARQAKVGAMSAGGKKKDGLFPQMGLFDEYGSAEFVKDHCDMLDLVNVIQSGMGPRREPRTVTTTTAGYAVNGPFALKLDGIKKSLLAELYLEATDTHVADFQLPFLLMPDEWEQRDEELMLNSPKVWRKANPMIGVSVQPDFYRQQSEKAKLDSNERKEFLTKLVNVYQQNTITEWIKPSEITPLQLPMRVDDCIYDSSWSVYCGMDFSKGDDLHAVTYLCYNEETGQYFADMDAWMSEDAMSKSTISSLLQVWVRQGWLHISPGKVLEPSLPINRIMELDEKGVNFIAFGYDSYQSKEPINQLKSWLMSALGIADVESMVMPISQTFASYNPAVMKVDYCVKANPPRINFSSSPMWPWEFGNCVLEEDTRMGNHKPLKRNPGSDGCKVDNIQCLCTCFILEETIEGKVLR